MPTRKRPTRASEKLLDAAVIAAWRHWCTDRGYQTFDKAVSTLRRNVPGYVMEERIACLTLAKSFVEYAIRVAQQIPPPKPPAQYVTAEDQMELGDQLRKAFPTFSDKACRLAASFGMLAVWK